MQNASKDNIRSHATEAERKEMYDNCLRIGDFSYEEYEDLAKHARSQEEREFYEDKAHWAFKSREMLEFGP